MNFIITDIVHSGRKGIRLNPVTSPKYDGLLGVRGRVNLDIIQQFKRFSFDLIGHSYYDYWTVSEVLGVKTDIIKGIIEIETYNSIYTFKALTDTDKQELKNFADKVKGQ